LYYYSSLGYNILLWNYRGYGHSTGRTNPRLIQQDGLSVARYLKDVKNAEVLGIHGESMGGAIA